MAFILRLALWASLVLLSASELLLDVQPNVISEELTSKLVINCSISNNQVQQIDIIKSLSLARYNETIKEFEDLLILEAATLNLTQFVQFQRSQIGFGNLYIILNLEDPTKSDARVYRCNVNGDTANMTNISLVNKKEVKYETISTALLDEVRHFRKDAGKNQCSSEKEEITYSKKQRSKLLFVGSSKVINELIEPFTLTCTFEVSNLHADKNSTVEFMYIFHEENGLIATINKGQPIVTANQEANSMNVKGELADNTLHDSHLQVTWNNLRSSDSGKYFCGAHVIGSNGRAERLNEMVTVMVKRATVEDLVKVIEQFLRQVNNDREILHDNKQKIKNIQEKMTSKKDDGIRISKDIDNHKDNFIRINTDLDSKQQNILSIKQDIDAQKQNIVRIKIDLESQQNNIISIRQDSETTKKDFNEYRRNISTFQETVENVLRNLSSSLIEIKQQIDKVNNKVQVSCQCLPKPTSCRDVVSTEDRVVVTLASGLEVMCDTKTAGGGWIIFQRRFNGTVDFYRGWKEYREGFGDYNIGEFYLGNENIFRLLSKRRHELRVDLEFKGNKYFAKYVIFQLSNEFDNYRLYIHGYSGNASNGLQEQNYRSFSTYDRDNDNHNTTSCAVKYHGAWWYNRCHLSNLNGLWGTKEFGKGLEWFNLTGEYDSVTFSEMKIREIV